MKVKKPIWKKLMQLSFCALAGLALASCTDDNDLEDAADEVGDAIEDAGDEAEDALD